MVKAEKTRTRVQMQYGAGQGSHMVNGLIPEATDRQAHATAQAMNLVQLSRASYFHKIEEYRLTEEP